MLRRFVFIAFIVVAGTPLASAQDLSFGPVTINSPSLGTSIQDLAERELTMPDNENPSTQVANRTGLQLAAGRYTELVRSIAEAGTAADRSVPRLALEVFARAKESEIAGQQFVTAYLSAYEAVAAPLTDRTAYELWWFLGRLPDINRQDFARLVEPFGTPTRITRTQAVELVRSYAWWQASRQFWPLLPRAIDADDRRRYVVDNNVRVKTPDGATVTAVLMRPRTHSKLPTLLAFGIYATPTSVEDARETASHGYVSVLGFSRGKYHSTDPIVPFDHDAADARSLIDWIAKQAWSDGRVGMYGGSYLAFVQWAVAKNPPSALKAMMPSAPLVPGIAGPMEGNLFLSYQYRFVPYVTHGPFLDEEGYADMTHWHGLNKTWYSSGRPYREMDQIDGTPNPLYSRLLSHPSYDSFWKQFTPQQGEFARLNIPVLVVTGYYDGAQIGARYMFDQHHQYNSKADQTIVIGPFSHTGAQHQADFIVGGGYRVDPSARMDFHELRYAWFDHELRGGPRPALLQDRVNYQVMGEDIWRHASSFGTMSNASIQFHLVPAGDGAVNRLAPEAPPRDSHTDLVVDLADRSDVDWLPPDTIVRKSLDTHNALAFVSEPLATDTEISGLVGGTLDFEINKRDMDLVIRLYEQSTAGDLLELSVPYVQRASFLRDRSRRQLLRPGERQTLVFQKPGPVSRLVRRGSRLVLVLGIQKERDAQVNYGTGKDVSDESIGDAGQPLKVRWFGSSVLNLPVRRD
jgi:putative CocE/NonD family hydrolase